MGQVDGSKPWVLVALSAMILSGCLGTQEDGGFVSRFGAADASRPEAESRIITDLQTRSSVLPPDSAFAQVAQWTLAAYSRTGEADLRAARLRSEAASKNWLPRVGPDISLTSLDDFVANLIVEQVIFDNGRLKAERAFAKADVEVVAVELAADTNARIFDALSLYLDAAEGRERARLDRRTLDDMARFEWVMQERVKGGISDRSDLNVLRQKLGEIRASLAANDEAAETALAELNAMSAAPLDDVRGLGDIPVAINAAKPLDVLRAEAEKERDIAQARIDRAGRLPGVTAGGTAGEDTDLGVNLRADQLLGLGTGDELKAIETQKEAAARRVLQAKEDSDRTLKRLEQRLAALSRQVGEASALTVQARANLDLFQEQYDAGQRQVMDVVGVYETFADREERSVGLKYELALTRLEIARHLGLLADGSEV